MVADNNPAGVIDSGYSFTVLYYERHDVKIDEAILRIKNFHVMTHWSAAFRKRFPVQTANTFGESVANRIRRFQSKQSASCLV